MLALMQGISSQTDMIFARRLRIVREASGLTKQQVADAMTAAGFAQVHRSTVGKIESGDRPVTIGEAVALAAALGASLAALATGPPPDARTEAQARVRAMEYAAERKAELAREAQFVHAFALEVLEDARLRLAALGGDD